VTSNAERAATLARALRAGATGDTATVSACCTDDVRGWAPSTAVANLGELCAALDRRDDAFSDVVVEVQPLDVGGDYACAEWTVAMTHTGPLALADGTQVDATGTRVIVHGVTVAEFREERVCSFRQYWDEVSVFEQLGY
jgi:ketosteroid isomerase-like protein